MLGPTVLAKSSILVYLLKCEHCKTCMIFLWQKPAQQSVPIRQVTQHLKNKVISNTETTTASVNLDDFYYFLGRESQVV